MTGGVYIRFECGRDERMGEDDGPYDFIQATYETIRAGEDGEHYLAHLENGEWHTPDGQIWSDFVIFGGTDKKVSI